MNGHSQEVALLLIRRGGIAAASLQSPFAGSPLHLACLHGSEIQILKELINLHPMMASLPNERGVKPAQILWFHFEKENRANMHLLELLRAEDSQKNGKEHELAALKKTVKDLFERVRLLVDGVKKQSSANARSSTPSPSLLWDMVETHSTLGDLSRFLEISVLLFPEQLSVPDKMGGNYPLHLAALNREPLSDFASRRHGQGGCSKGTIDILVEAFPSAAGRRNHKGEYPLHLALTVGRRTWRTGIASLVKAFPDSLQGRDRGTGLYPFQLAAAFPWGKPEESLETVFQLLVTCPALLI
jgi:hypothetical protein